MNTILLHTNELKSFASRFALITDDNVASLYGKQLCHSLRNDGVNIELFTIRPGEEHKTRKTKEELEDQLLQEGYGRDSCIIALGGGVVCDVAGFLAATYCRGVPLVMIPTTLLAMVDASIGGKNGVNVPQGKNMIGTIYRPKAIWTDLSLLSSLPEREIKNGIVEMIKHGIIYDNKYFEFMDSHAEDILALDSATLEKAIADSYRIKTGIVEEDEFEKGKRHLLNFGHTVGHALETLTHYSLSHGEAVAIGIVVESRLALQLGHLSQVAFDRICNIFAKFSIDTTFPEAISHEDLLSAMSMDKKSVNNNPRFVLIDDIGSPFAGEYCSPVDAALIVTAPPPLSEGAVTDSRTAPYR